MQRSDRYCSNHFSGTRGALVALWTGLALSACGSSDEPPVAAPTKPVVKREQVPEDPTAKMARAVPIGGATAPVNIKYEILNKPIVGSPVEIELAVIPTQVADSMTITYTGSTGLTLSTDAPPTIDAMKANQIERLKFSVQAREESVVYVTVTATVFLAGSSSVRSFAIPIIISAPKAATEHAPPAVKKS